MTQSAPKAYELLFSDHELGHPELGYIPRKEDPDDEDRAFARHLRRAGFSDVRVHDGRATVVGPPSKGA